MSYQPPDPFQAATPRPAAPAGQYSPDGRWYWDGRQWIPVTAPGPTWAAPYGPAEGRAAAAVALVALAMAGLAILLVTSILDIFSLALGPGSAVAVAEAIVGLLGLIAYLAGLIGGAIAVPMWMHRAFRNLPALGEQTRGWSPAWAAGGWFIPFANLVIPYLVIRVLWSSFGAGGPLPQQYWAAWIAVLVLNIVSYVVALFNGYAGDVLAILEQAAAIAAGLLLVTIIRRVTRRQRDRHAQLPAR